MRQNVSKKWYLMAGLGLAMLTGCGGGAPTEAPAKAYVPTVGANVGTMLNGYELTKVLQAPSREEVELMHLVNEVRTKGTINGESAQVAGSGTCIEGNFTPRQALSYSGVLAYSANKHAQYMGNVGYKAHEEAAINSGYELDKNATYFWGKYNKDRILRTLNAFGFDDKYDFVAGNSGENVAAGTPGESEHGGYIDGYADAEETMWAWMRSPSHCQNVMRANWHYMGMGYFYNANPNITDEPRLHMHSWVQTFSEGRPNVEIVWE